MDNDYEPNTPVIKDDAVRSKEDPNEILLGDDEVEDDEED